MWAIITAGGIPRPKDPLYPYTQGKSKALLDVAGKPMIQWVLDAVGGSQRINGALVMGLEADSGLTFPKPLHFMPNQGSMVQNILIGMRRVVELDPSVHHVLIVSSDIPTIRPEMVDWVIDASMQTDEDLYYNIISRKVMEARFPGSRRTYTRLKDMEVCGGDMNVLRILSIHPKIWDELFESRKNPFKQAAIIGWDTLFLLLIGRIGLQDGVSRVAKRLGLTGRALVCPYAEIGMDVDKPSQLEMLRADLEKRVQEHTAL